MTTNRLIPFSDLPLDRRTVRDLRSDHAGECGAAAIYRGILAVSRDPAVREFAREHLETEESHYRFFDRWLPHRHQSRLLPVWRLAGWLLGALPALVGPRAVFRTIAAVETFVEGHYLEQIDRIGTQPELASLAVVLQQFCDEEIVHRDDAAARLPAGNAGGFWPWVVGAGSSLGVSVARLI